ncbi:7566_t:CDS:2, partial [Entrophospora sp. SA101]
MDLLNNFESIRIPFPPTIKAEDFLDKRFYSGSTRKGPNSFFVYRKAFVSHLQLYSYKLKMTVVSSLASKAWKKEPTEVKNHYKSISRKIERLLVESRQRELINSYNNNHGSPFSVFNATSPSPNYQPFPQLTSSATISSGDNNNDNGFVNYANNHHYYDNNNYTDIPANTNVTLANTNQSIGYTFDMSLLDTQIQHALNFSNIYGSNFSNISNDDNNNYDNSQSGYVLLLVDNIFGNNDNSQ